MPPSIEKSEKKKKRAPHPEANGLILLAATLLTLLCLISFSSGHQADNFLGKLGYGVGWTLYFIAGLLIYPILGYLAYLGWNLLVFQKIEQLGTKNFYFSLYTISLGFLLNLIAECYPNAVSFLSDKVYAESLILALPYPHAYTRYNLGGVPLYYLYKDLPVFNLFEMLSTVGLTIISSITLLVSFLSLTEIQLVPLLQRFYAYLLSKKKVEKDPPIETFVNTSATEELEQRLARHLSIGPRVRPMPQTPPTPPQIASKRESALAAQAVVNGDYAGYKLPPPLFTQQCEKS